MLRAVPENQRTGTGFPLIGLNGEPVSDLRQVSRLISVIGKTAKVIVDKASGKYASAHDLRRAFGVRWSLRVMPAVLQAMMRHADISTKMKYYVGQQASAMQATIYAAYSRVNIRPESPTARTGQNQKSRQDKSLLN